MSTMLADGTACVIRDYRHPGEHARRTEILEQFGMLNGNRDSAEQIAVISRRPGSILMAEVGKLAVGTIMIGNGDGIGIIEALAVDSAHQGRGIGSALLDAAEAELSRRGYTHAELLVDEHKRRLIDLYKKRGYYESWRGVGLAKKLSAESANHDTAPDSPLVRYAVERIHDRHARAGNHQRPYLFKHLNLLYAVIQASKAPDLPRLGFHPSQIWPREGNAVRPTPWVPWGEYYQRWMSIPTYTEDLLLRTEVLHECQSVLGADAILMPPGWYVSYNYASEKAQVFGVEDSCRFNRSYSLAIDPSANSSILQELIDQTRAYDVLDRPPMPNRKT